MSANSAVLALTEERIDSNNKLQTFVQKASALTIPLFPETVQFTDTALQYGAALVTVNTQLDDYGNNRDIYKNESGGYCLHLTKLNEIAQQAGLQIIDSRVLERKVDEKGRVTYIEHQVKWKMRSVDGSTKEGTATGKYDYYRDYDTLKKDGKPNEKQINARRKHAEALAESNALTRAYNKAIAKLPQGFTLAELKKPFLIPYVIEDKDELLKDLPKEDQLQIKKELARKRLGISNQIYNAPKPQIEEAKIIDETPSTSHAVPHGSGGMSKESQNNILANEFRQSSQEERTEKILNLCKLKNYKLPATEKRPEIEVTKQIVEKSDLEKQIAFIEMLLNMPEPIEEETL